MLFRSGFYSLRVWCSNGAKNWSSDIALSCKNTSNNQFKLLSLVPKFIDVTKECENYVTMLNKATQIKVTQTEIETYICNLLGFKPHELIEQSKKMRNIFDAINASAHIEMSNTGKNLFSLLQGATRWVTHDFAEGNTEKILYTEGAKYNQKAHILTLAMMN